MTPSLPTPAIPVKYKDLSLTFRANPVTGDVTTLTGNADVQASVVNLIMTMNYEIPFHPEVGCAVTSSLFEDIGPMTAASIRSSIINVLQNFEPRVSVLDVIVNAYPDENGYSATIVYRIINQTSPVTITVFLEKKR
jgi:phage baseplate assembly protein W